MIEVRTQAEADAAIASGEKEIHVYADVQIVIRCGYEPLIVAWGSSQPRVVARGSSQPRVVAWGSSQPRVVARGSSQPRVVARESSQPRVEAWGSSQPRVEAWGSSQPRVVAWESSQPRVVARAYAMLSISGACQVEATSQVRVMIDGGAPGVSGGIVHRVIPPKTPQEWCEAYGASVTDGIAVLYKAVSDDFRSDRGFGYTPGSVPIAPDWDGGTKECGGGLHFCSSPTAARRYFGDATRYVACPVALADIAVHSSPVYPDRIKARGCCDPVWECDEDGNPVNRVRVTEVASKES